MKAYPYLALLPALACAGCSDDPQSPAEGDSRDIVFCISADAALSRSDGAVRDTGMLTLTADGCEPVAVSMSVSDMTHASTGSRGTPVNGTGDLKDFSIYSWFYRDAAAAAQPFFTRETAQDHGGYWSTPTTYYWPTGAATSLSFWALAGIDTPGVNIIDPGTGPDDMTIEYNVPREAPSQTDLLLATTGRINTPGERVPLTFRHLCAAVRFVAGSEMQPGTIRSITLSGIASQGRYTGTWSTTGSKTDFTLTTDKDTDENTPAGSALTTQYNTMMMLPQRLGDDATLTVVFEDRVTGTERRMSASLAGREWRQGTVTTYHIGITPEYKLEFTQQPDTQDAHYVICRSAVHISGLPAGKAWTLTVSPSDDSDPSIQLTADINEFARQGFWTDREMSNGSPTSRSARGSRQIKGTGPGEFPLTVFLPENISDSPRTVTLTLSVDGAPTQNSVTQQILQLAPGWTGNTGWEQIDDNENAAYGFSYTAHHVYVYYDGYFNVGSGAETLRQIKSMIDNIIAQYNASGYTDIIMKRHWAGKYRYAVDINYEKLSNLGLNAASASDGLTNTRQLFNFGGSGVTSTFETALQGLRRIGDESVTAFRKRDNASGSIDNDFGFPQWVEGTAINESQALSAVLKKNRYYLNRYTDSGTGMEATAPRILETDIVWYLPARDEFAALPADYNSSGTYWSSTACDNATEAYSGDGTPTLRSTRKKIAAARRR